MNRTDYIGYGLLVIVVLGIVLWVISGVKDLNNQEDDLVRRQFSGILVSIDESDHGFAMVGIKQHGGGEQLSYDLAISSFLREHDIKVNDSISKEADSHIVTFYKKKDGSFEECCALDY